MSLDFQFVLLQPRHVQLLSGRSTLELSRDITVVVADDSADVVNKYTQLNWKYKRTS